MVRKTENKPSLVRVYKHFAVVTIVLTTAVAVFADGEAVQAVEQEMAERKEERRLDEANEEAFVKNELVRRDPHADRGGGSFGPDQSLGAPSLAARDSGGSVSTVATRMPGEQPIWERLGMSEAEWYALPPATRRQLSGSNDVFTTGSEEERRAAMDRLTEQSRGRSGGEGSGSDY